MKDVIKMFDKFVPDIYSKSIYTIDYKMLKKNKVKCLIFDLNNTIAPLTLKKPSKKLIDLFEITAIFMLILHVITYLR